MRRLCFLSLLVSLGAGCDPGSTREWTPADHDQTDQPSLTKTNSAEAQTQLIDISWNRQCAICHGSSGRGDGPNGPMVQAPDLTRVDWQTSVSDQQIAQMIREGKGRMPGFNLPPAIVDGLVQRVRQLRGP